MLNWLKNLLFPPKCIFCNTILDIKNEEFICDKCPSKIPFFDQEIEIRPDDFFDGVICIFKYKGIAKSAIIRYKFHNKISYATVFAQLLSEKIKKTENCQDIDLILSVPLHKKKEQIRGYNQAHLIAKELSKLQRIDKGTNILKRVKNTKPQSLLPKHKRQSNVEGAFVVEDFSQIIGKNILIIDDIMTTGNTLNECSRILKEAGAKNILAAVLATGRNS